MYKTLIEKRFDEQSFSKSSTHVLTALLFMILRKILFEHRFPLYHHPLCSRHRHRHTELEHLGLFITKFLWLIRCLGCKTSINNISYWIQFIKLHCDLPMRLPSCCMTRLPGNALNWVQLFYTVLSFLPFDLISLHFPHSSPLFFHQLYQSHSLVSHAECKLWAKTKIYLFSHLIIKRFFFCRKKQQKQTLN